MKVFVIFTGMDSDLQILGLELEREIRLTFQELNLKKVRIVFEEFG